MPGGTNSSESLPLLSLSSLSSNLLLYFFFASVFCLAAVWEVMAEFTLDKGFDC